MIVIIKALHLPCQNEQQNRDAQVRSRHVNPNVQRQRRQEREQVRRLFNRLAVEHRNSQVHEGHREVHYLLPKRDSWALEQH